jgi:hypothetical protein
MPPAFVVNKPRISAAMEAALQRHIFSKVLSAVALYSKCTMTLTFEEFCRKCATKALRVSE